MNRLWRIGAVPGIMLATAALIWAIGGGVSTSPGAGLGGGAGQYGRLCLEGGQVVFYEAERKSTIQPPRNPLPGRRAPAERSGTFYTLDTEVVRDDLTGALNLLAKQGWQPIALAGDARALTILMKRGQ